MVREDEIIEYETPEFSDKGWCDECLVNVARASRKSIALQATNPMNRIRRPVRNVKRLWCTQNERSEDHHQRRRDLAQEHDATDR